MFGDFAEGGFGGLAVAFRLGRHCVNGVEELLAQGGEFVAGIALNFGEFGVDDSEGLGFVGDGGVHGPIGHSRKGWEGGEEGVQVGNSGFNLGISGMIVFDGGRLDLDAGGGGESRVVFEKPNQGVGVEQMGHSYM